MAMDDLDEAYSKVQRVLGNRIEALESVQLVETYRRYFKPERIRVLLLAESHVYTNDGDRQIVIPTIPELPGYPTQYARFVYCLGYGERSLTKSEVHPRRDGTPQFWKIFYSCCNRVSCLDDFKPILGRTAADERLANKIKLLSDMKARGIWLVDASIVALYDEGKKVPDMFRALQESWQSYTRQVVTSSNPEQVICIGVGVANVVCEDLNKYFHGRYTVVPQPNAFLQSAEHMSNYRMYSEKCC
jgi:hypothetical protein